MKVPHEPEPPFGAPGSVRVFRAGINYYRLKVLRWAIGQVGAVIGIGFSLVFLGFFGAGLEQARRTAESQDPAAAATVRPGDGEAEPTPTPSRARSRAERRREGEQRIARVLTTEVPPYLLPFITFLEIGGIVFLVAQMFLTFALVRLEFEQHWYMVTDRSLRIRTGVLRLQESTMSFANLQQVEIRQGPLQRLLGLADVCVRSAGGGDDPQGAKGHREEASLHLGVFQGVANAVEIRDLILERLRRFREAGLGDPEDRHHSSEVEAAPGTVSAQEAASELLAEARALGRVLAASRPYPAGP